MHPRVHEAVRRMNRSRVVVERYDPTRMCMIFAHEDGSETMMTMEAYDDVTRPVPRRAVPRSQILAPLALLDEAVEAVCSLAR